jgi:hypothetical protein
MTDYQYLKTYIIDYTVVGSTMPKCTSVKATDALEARTDLKRLAMLDGIIIDKILKTTKIK